MTTATISVKKFRENLASVIKSVATKKSRVIIEKGGIPVSVVMNYNDYEEMIEELEDLALACNPEVLQNIKEARRQYKAGKTRSFEDFAKELGI